MPIPGFSRIINLQKWGKAEMARCPWRSAEGLRRWIRFFLLRLCRLQGNSQKVAGGMAIGLFIGMTPIVPFQLVTALALAYCFRQSKMAAAIGTQVANPFLLPFIYLLDYQMGRWLVGAPVPAAWVWDDISLMRLIELGWRISHPMLIGGVAVGLLVSIPSYFIAVRYLALYPKKAQKA